MGYEDLRRCIIEKNKRKKIITQRYKRAIVNARDKNLPFDITIDDVLLKLEQQNGCSKLSGTLLSFDKNDPDVISIDQIEPRGGYTFENIMLITFEENKSKSNVPLRRFINQNIKIAKFFPKFFPYFH